MLQLFVRLNRLEKYNGRLVSRQGAKIKNEGNKEIRDLSTSARIILSMNCEDIQMEKPQFKYIVEDLLGCPTMPSGNCWKRRRIFLGVLQAVFPDLAPKDLQENVENALSTEVLTPNRLRKFARKARDYKLIYAFLINKGRRQ
jgi:hypothetical protein